MVSLRPITAANRYAVEALTVAPKQRRFVSGVRASMREAAAERDAQAPLSGRIYDDETPVGFVMIADDVAGADYIPHFLWKLLIDERFQRRGIGTATLHLIVEYFRGRVSTRCRRARGKARAAPSRSTSDTDSSEPGELHGNEIMLRLEIAQ